MLLYTSLQQAHLIRFQSSIRTLSSAVLVRVHSVALKWYGVAADQLALLKRSTTTADFTISPGVFLEFNFLLLVLSYLYCKFI